MTWANTRRQAVGNNLIVQACRRSGTSSSAQLSVEALPIDTSGAPKASLVRVSTANAERKSELQGLGLDLTEWIPGAEP